MRNNYDASSFLVTHSSWSDIDTNNDEFEKECLQDKTTKESFLSLIEDATTGEDLLSIIDRLPNSSN